MNGCVRSRRGAEEGAAAIEAVLIVGVLLVLVFGSVELGRAFWTYNTMLLAVEEAGRYAMVNNQRSTGVCKAQSQAASCPKLSDTPLANCSAARARQILSDYRTWNIDVSAEEDSTSFPATMTICTSYSFDFIAPQLLPYGPLNLTSRITVPLM